MLSIKRLTIPSSYSTPTNTVIRKHRRAILRFKHSYSIGSAAASSVGSFTTPKTDSNLSDSNVFNENDYELTRQIMRDLIEEIKVEKPFISFNDIFFDQDNIIGCLLRIFDEYAENINGIKQITREQMLKLLESVEIIDSNYTSSMFINDWNNLRKQMIKKKIYERKSKNFDFVGFVQMIDIIKTRSYESKDEIFKKIISSQTYNDIIKLKEVRDKIHLGLLPSMTILMNQFNDVSGVKVITIDIEISNTSLWINDSKFVTDTHRYMTKDNKLIMF